MNKLYEVYVKPGEKKNQWTAMAKYSKEHGYRIVLFLAFKKVNDTGSKFFEEIITKNGLEDGVIAIVGSFDF